MILYLKRKTVMVISVLTIISMIACLMPEASNAAKAGWVKKSGKKVAYRYSNGKNAKGVVKIGKRIYYFKKNGKLAKAKRERRIKLKGELYDVKKDGSLRTGWNVFKNSLYYFSKKTGRAQCGTIVDKITLKPSGKAFRSLDADLKIKVIKLLKNRGVFDKSKRVKLRSCWNWILSHCHYRIKYPLLRHGKWKWGYSPANSSGQGQLKKCGATWIKRYAHDMLGHSRGGNCYGFACVFAACANDIGYSPKVVVARTYGTGNRDGNAGLANDGYSRHAWVKINGRVYDPEAALPRWGQYVYGRKSRGLRCKAKKTIDYKKVDGTKTYSGKKPPRILKTTLVKKGGKVFYYTAKGKKTIPKDRVILCKNKYYHFNKKGKIVSGLFVFKRCLYSFKKKDRIGYYMSKADFFRYQKLIKEGSSFKALQKEIGPEISMTEDRGCYSTEDGMERIYVYKNILVSTFVPILSESSQETEENPDQEAPQDQETPQEQKAPQYGTEIIISVDAK